MINKSIFKSYDVRGIYPSELNEEVAFAIGKAFVDLTKAKNIVVGYDARLSSLSLFKALISGISERGSKITSIGQSPTEGIYFAVAKYNFDGGIMITASHNPKDYNGMKMMIYKRDNIIWIRGKDLLNNIKFSEDVKNIDQIEIKDIWVDYIDFMVNKFAFGIKKKKIVIDASNGVIGPVIEKLKNKLPIEIIDLNFKPDGSFPNHSPNPLEEGSINQIKESIIKNNAECGFIFDGDADRIFLVDEKGQLVSADATRLILAKHFFKKNPGAVIIYDVICSRAVPEFIKKWGGIGIKSKVGFVNIRESLIENNGIMGGELSSHYCFKDYFYMDSGIIAFLILLQEISLDNRTISEITKELSLYKKAPTINFEIEDKDLIIEKIKQKYSDGKQDFLDGITVEYENWWFNVRPSNTEPLLRLTIEADTKELLEQKKKELADFINKK